MPIKTTIRAVFLLVIAQTWSVGQIINTDSLKQELQLARKPSDKAAICFELITHYNRSQPDSNAIYIEMVRKLAGESGSKELQARVFQAEANHLQNTGRFKESVEASEKAITIYESLNDVQGLANAYNTLGLTYKKNSGDENELQSFSLKALEYEEKALAYYLETADFDGLMRVYSNLGIIYRDLKQFENAEAEFLKGIEIAKKYKYTGYHLGILNANLSQIYLDYYKDHHKAIGLLNQALALYEKNGIRSSMEHAYRNISYNYTELGEYEKAIEFAKKAIEVANEVKDPHRQINAYSALHHAQKKARMYKESLENLEFLNDIEDSLLNKEKTAIIGEMAMRFETVKKEAQIQLLQKEKEINAWKIAGLLAGLLAMGVFAFFIVQKRKKDRLLFEKERIIQNDKREKAEMELESKQKELTAKVLQLAHKNEFLSHLEHQISHLKENVDQSVIQTSSRISRLIRRDIESDTQWEQFSQEFSSIHQGFLGRLAEKFGTFTKSEVRLISLLKMNMTSKEIADIMGISDDGVKKARYRLRKKMNLEDSELQGYLLSFS